MANETYQYLNDEIMADGDLAAHIMITNNRGICIEGSPIDDVFPVIPPSHYLSSIMEDYKDCLENIEKDPVYCTLNLLRVFWYLKAGVISSKQEAGEWGMASLPSALSLTVEKVINSYLNSTYEDNFETGELLSLRDYIAKNVAHLSQVN